MSCLPANPVADTRSRIERVADERRCHLSDLHIITGVPYAVLWGKVAPNGPQLASIARVLGVDVGEL